MTWNFLIEQTDELDARIALARIALVAYRSGVEAACAFARGCIDPFDGLPLRCSQGSDGLLMIWSVGADGIDEFGRQGSTVYPDDLVWTIRRAEGPR